jgi:hypothetical protein
MFQAMLPVIVYGSAHVIALEEIAHHDRPFRCCAVLRRAEDLVFGEDGQWKTSMQQNDTPSAEPCLRELTYEISAAHFSTYLTLANAHVHKTSAIRRVIMLGKLGYFTALAIASVFAYYALGLPGFDILCGGAAITSAYSIIAIRLFRRSYIGASFTGQSSLVGPQVLRVRPTGIEVENAVSRCFLTWRAFVAIVDKADVIVLMRKPQMGVIVPYSAFPTPENRQTFLSCMRELSPTASSG